ncbi:MAG: SdrD B-like domain-containing protein [Planctomycetota bacterium]
MAADFPGVEGRTVYIDANGNEIPDAGDTVATTDAGGAYSFGGLGPGTYVIRQELPAGWRESDPADGAYEIVLGDGEVVARRDFVNVKIPSISGRKFEDLNGNGTYDPGEPGLQGWTIYLDANGNEQQDAEEAWAATYGDGRYALVDIDAGPHLVREVPQAGWVPTMPSQGFYPVMLPAGGSVADADFGSYRPVMISGSAHMMLPESRVNTHTEARQSHSAVATDAIGNFVVVWESVGEDGDGAGIFAQRYNLGGVAQGEPFAVNTTTAGDQTRPAVAMNANGQFVVIWESADSDGKGVFARMFQPGGSSPGDEIPVNTTTVGDQELPDVGVAFAGNFVVTWQSDGQDGDKHGIVARCFNSDGTERTGELPVNATTSGEQRHPAVVTGSIGDFVVVWDHQGPYGRDAIFGRRFHAFGTALGDEFRVDLTGADWQGHPAAAIYPGGSFVVAWQGWNGPGGQSGDIYARRFNWTGEPLEDDFRVNSTTAGLQTRPQVAVDGDNDIVVVWQSEGQDGQAGGVYAQRFNMDGTRPESECQVNTVAVGVQEYPSVAMDAEGDFFVTWNGYLHDGNDTDVYMRAISRDVQPGLGLSGVMVYLDADNNGYWDAGETGTSTDADGNYQFAGLAPGTHTVRKLLTPEWLPASPLGGYYSFTVTSSDEVIAGSFGGELLQSNSIAGQAFNDLDFQYMVLGEPGLVGIRVYLDANNNGKLDPGETSTRTNAAGYYAFAGLSPGEHVVRQDVPLYAWPTMPLGAAYRVTLSAGQWQNRWDFGNYVPAQDQVEVASGLSASGTDVAIGPDGRSVVTWAADHERVLARQYDLSAVAQTDVLQANTVNDGWDWLPAVDVDGDGNFVVVWSGDDWDQSAYDDVWMRRYTSAGVPLSPDQVRVSTNNDGWQYPSSVAFDADGDFVVAWGSWNYLPEDAITGIAAQRFNADGTRKGGEIEVTSLIDGWDAAAVAVDPDGDFLVVWDQYDAATEDWDVAGRRYDDQGNPLSGVFPVNSVTDDLQGYTSVAVDADGDAVVVWASYGEDGSGYGIYAQRYNAAGQAQGGPFRVSTTTGDYQLSPTVDMRPGGDFLVAWESYDQDGDAYGVFAQAFNAFGQPLGGELPINTVTDGSQRYPQVAVNARSDLAVVWNTDTGGDDESVSFRVFPSMVSSISGRKFEDLNGNGAQDPGEPGLEGCTIFLDRDRDGSLGPSEPSITTDANGDYTFRFLHASTYSVRDVLPAGYVHTTPAPPADGYTLNLWGRDDVEGIDFGVYLPPIPALASVYAVVREPDAGLPADPNGEAETLPFGSAGRPADPNGEAETLPQHSEWIDEWDSFWVELWISTDESSSQGVEQASVDLYYDTDLFTAIDVEPGPAFDPEYDCVIDDAAGHLDGINGRTSEDVGDDQYVLFARVWFEPTAADQGCPNNADGQYITPVDLGLALTEAQVELAGLGSADVDVVQPDPTEVWPVPYDADDDNKVGFGDLAFLAEAFHQHVGDPGAQFAYLCDYDRSDRVDVGDLSFLAVNFQASREGGEPLVFPADFPSAWRSGGGRPARALAPAPAPAEVDVPGGTPAPPTAAPSRSIEAAAAVAPLTRQRSGQPPIGPTGPVNQPSSQQEALLPGQPSAVVGPECFTQSANSAAEDLPKLMLEAARSAIAGFWERSAVDEELLDELLDPLADLGPGDS